MADIIKIFKFLVGSVFLVEVISETNIQYKTQYTKYSHFRMEIVERMRYCLLTMIE